MYGMAFEDSRWTIEGPAGLTVNVITARRRILISELAHNTSRSATNTAEYLAPELIQRHFPQRFEELPPAIFLEQYVEERTPQGRLGRKATWDRLSFHSWAPRRVWLSGQERISFGDPHWEHLPEHEVEALLGREEIKALPPSAPLTTNPS
jgi:hypothetical protein